MAVSLRECRPSSCAVAQANNVESHQSVLSIDSTSVTVHHTVMLFPGIGAG
jgi:hypothetical protein